MSKMIVYLSIKKRTSLKNNKHTNEFKSYTDSKNNVLKYTCIPGKKQ